MILFDMTIKTRKIVAVWLMMLILFSTIGFNIISTFCDGCTDEHTSITITPPTDVSSCNCCDNKPDEQQCCALSEEEHAREHHQTKSVFAKLKFDSPEAKSISFDVVTPVFLLHLITIVFNIESVLSAQPFELTNNLAPPLSGRTILQLICILRN